MSTFQILPWADCSPKSGTSGEFVLFHDRHRITADYFAQPQARRTTTVTIVWREHPKGRLRKVGSPVCKLTISGTAWAWQAPILEKLMARLNDGTLATSALPSFVGESGRAWAKLRAIVKDKGQTEETAIWH